MYIYTHYVPKVMIYHETINRLVITGKALCLSFRRIFHCALHDLFLDFLLFLCYNNIIIFFYLS